MAKDGHSDNKQTAVGRFTWLAVFSPSTTGYKGAARKTPRYEAAIIIPKTHPNPQYCQNYQMLMGLLAEAARTGVPGGQIPPMDRKDFPIRDCDADPAELAKKPYIAGHWRIKAGGERKPSIFVAPSPQPVLLPEINGKPTIKSGDFGVLSIHAYTWGDKKGQSFGLEAIAKTSDGDAIGSGDRDGSEIFSGILQPGQNASGQGYNQPAGPGQTYVPQGAYQPPQQPGYGQPPAHGYGQPPQQPIQNYQPAPPQDPRANWQRDPSGQWVQNPQNGQWEPAPAAPTPQPLQQGGYQPPLAQPMGQPQYAQTAGYPAPGAPPMHHAGGPSPMTNGYPQNGYAGPGSPVPMGGYATQNAGGPPGPTPGQPGNVTYPSNGVPPIPNVPQYAQPQYQPLQPPQPGPPPGYPQQGFVPPLAM